MFGIGMPEMILILAVALIVIGPKKLPGLAKSLGRALGEFKSATRDIKESISMDDEFKDVKKSFNDISADVRGTFSDEIKTTPGPGLSSTDPPESTPSEEKDTEDTEDKTASTPETEPLNEFQQAFSEMNGEAETTKAETSEAETGEAETGETETGKAETGGQSEKPGVNEGPEKNESNDESEEKPPAASTPTEKNTSQPDQTG